MDTGYSDQSLATAGRPETHDNLTQAAITYRVTGFACSLKGLSISDASPLAGGFSRPISVSLFVGR